MEVPNSDKFVGLQLPNFAVFAATATPRKSLSAILRTTPTRTTSTTPILDASPTSRLWKAKNEASRCKSCVFFVADDATKMSRSACN